MARCLGELCQNFAQLQSGSEWPVDLIRDADHLTLDVDRAINVALIAGEAITNALKHAFPDGPNHPHFPPCVLDPGRVSRQITELRFGFL